MQSPFLRTIAWVVVCAAIVLLAVTTGSAAAHEFQHTAHHDAGMHASGICAWMCATAGLHVVASVYSTQVFEIVSLPPFDPDHGFLIQLLAPSHSRAPPASA
ncbi:MAG: hypothetical protein H0V35_08515 [Nitrospira sp.]|nr:hypothetical protein [Nitrospira sp.]MBA3753684.1 hypothetical protein [Nitrospira sp.]